MAYVSKGQLILNKVASLEEKTDNICSAVEKNTEVLHNLFHQMNLLTDEIVQIKENSIEIEKLVELKSIERMQQIERINESLDCRLSLAADFEKQTQTELIDLARIQKQIFKDTKSIGLIIEEHTKSLQELMKYCRYLSDIINKLTDSNQKINMLIQQKNEENESSFEKIYEGLNDVVSSEKATRISIEEIGKVLSQNNDDTVKIIIELSEMTRRIFDDYQTNLNSVIVSIMAGNLVENISELEKKI